MDQIIGIITAVSVWELLLILCSKTLEVTIATLRVILINKGYRTFGTILSCFEIALWVIMASNVLVGLNETPIKGIVYGIGFVLGVFLGSCLESRLALGKVLIETIVSKENGDSVTAVLRGMGYAVTTVEARGRDSEKSVLKIFANRKGKDDIIKTIHEKDGTAMIIANDISTLQGGYISPRGKSIFK
ncbi:MAG: DUF5698 domain-containing protein [Treponema sp.]|nr:DUF5698 domain-containing protein [Treponema sp.]